MRPIVNGLKKKYQACIKIERVPFHSVSYWSDLIDPIGTPEFALLDSNETILYRWVGFTEEEEFLAVLDPLCHG